MCGRSITAIMSWLPLKPNSKPRYPKRFKVTTESDHNEAISPNLLNRQFDVAAPNKVWTTDITYVWTLEGWLYVAIVIDLFSRQVVGWSIADHMRTSLCVNALQMAFWRRKPEPGLVHHSDRGSQYASHEYRSHLGIMKMQQSMSRKGDCWDNAPTERFFRSLKHEQLNYEKFKTKEAAKLSIIDYLAFYNGIFTIPGHTKSLWACTNPYKPDWSGHEAIIATDKKCSQIFKCLFCSRVCIIEDSLPYLMERLSTGKEVEHYALIVHKDKQRILLSHPNLFLYENTSSSLPTSNRYSTVLSMFYRFLSTEKKFANIDVSKYHVIVNNSDIKRWQISRQIERVKKQSDKPNSETIFEDAKIVLMFFSWLLDANYITCVNVKKRTWRARYASRKIRIFLRCGV